MASFLSLGFNLFSSSIISFFLLLLNNLFNSSNNFSFSFWGSELSHKVKKFVNCCFVSLSLAFWINLFFSFSFCFLSYISIKLVISSFFNLLLILLLRFCKTSFWSSFFSLFSSLFITFIFCLSLFIMFCNLFKITIFFSSFFFFFKTFSPFSQFLLNHSSYGIN